MSMGTLLLKCQICLELKCPSDFKFFPCGHGFCYTPCIDNYFSLGTSKFPILCPVCRAKLRRVDARSLYLELPTPQEVQAVTTENLVHGLAQMNENSKAVSIQTARQKLKGYAETSDCGKDCATILLNALAQFNERIIPTFQKVEDQRKEIDLLRVQLKQRQQCIDDRQGRIETLVKERNQARNALQVTQAERDSALDLASQAAEKMLQLRADLTQARGQESDLQESKALYRTQLLDYKELQRKQNEKIKSLKKQLLVAKRAETSRRQEIDIEPQGPPGKRLMRATSPSPPSSGSTLSPVNVNSDAIFFEAMPTPGRIGSHWSVPHQELKKRKLPDSDHGFPIRLDQQGRPCSLVQTGSRKTIRRL